MPFHHRSQPVRPVEPPAPDPVLRRVVIEERQEQLIDRVRTQAGLAEDMSLHAHNRETWRLRNQKCALDDLPHAATVMPSLEDWKYWSKINDWDSRTAMLEELIGRLRRREATEGEVALLVVICGPTWNGVAKALRRACAGHDVDLSFGVRQREELDRVERVDRDALDQMLVETMLSELATCPTPLPRYFFPWLKETLSHRALDYLAQEIGRDDAVAEFIDEVLAERPQGRLLAPSFDSWLRSMNVPEMIDASYDFASYIKTQSACKKAVDRLPAGQRDVIEGHYFEKRKLVEIAGETGRAASTVRNVHMQALGNLRRDDVLFTALESIGKVRDGSRARELAEQEQLAA